MAEQSLGSISIDRPVTDLGCLIVPPPFQHLKTIDGGHFLHPPGILALHSTSTLTWVLGSAFFSSIREKLGLRSRQPRPKPGDA